MSIERTPENFRKIAKGQQYPPAMVKRALGEAADEIETAIGIIAEKNRLFDNLVITIAAIVVAAGGSVEVPSSILENIELFDLEKARGEDGATIYKTRRKES